MLRPISGWSRSSASGVPTDQHQRVLQGGQKGRSGEKLSKILQPDETGFRIKQAVVQRRKVDCHHQRDDHPDEQQGDSGRQQGPSEHLGLLVAIAASCCL
jgi:hypothetical protein